MSADDDLRTRVRQVIASSGLMQTAFAQTIELEPTKLSKALAGTRRFTPLELALIAEQGQTSTDWLLNGSSTQRADDPDALPDAIERVFGINVVIEDLRPGFDGLAWCRNGFRLILVSNAVSWTRQRFSLAHELGHVLAGDAQDLQVDIDVMAPSTAHADTELRANAFAAAFLIPAEAINAAADSMDDDAFARLVGRFGVSPSGLVMALLNLGYVDDRQRRRLGALALWECAKRGGWLDRYRALTRDQSEVRRPCLLSRDVLTAFEDGDVSARVLDIPPETLLPPVPPAQRSEGTDHDAAFVP